MRPKLCYKFLSKYSKGLPFSGFVRVFALEFVNIMKESREKYENYILQVLHGLFFLNYNKISKTMHFQIVKSIEKISKIV